MKKILCLLGFLFFFCNQSYSDHNEMNIVADSGLSIKIWHNNVYTHISTTGIHGKVYTNCGTGWATFFLSVGDDGQSAYGNPLEAESNYTIIIEGKAVDLTTSDVGTNQGDFTIYFNGSTFSLENCTAYNPRLTSSTYNWNKIDVTVQNSFSAGTVTVDNADYSSGTVFGWTSGNSHTLLAIDRQAYANYVRVFDQWTGQQSGYNLSLTATPTYTQTYAANFKKEYKIVFRNYGPAGSIGGVVNVNQTQYSSPTDTFFVTQGGTIRGTASTPQTLNAVIYTFSNWNGSIYSADYTFTPNDHTTYTANFSAKPEPPTDLYVSGDPGDQVILVWTDNPNQYVTHYKILRSWNKYRPYEYVATVNSGVETWTDDACQITSSYSDSLVHYAVVSKYVYGGDTLSSDYATTCTYGKEHYEAKRVQGAIQFVDIKRNSPKEYSIGNYPNPFNPSTTMFYQLVENSDVKLEIYDVAGRRVETLVDGHRSAGYHAKVWNAKEISGRSLSSGMYFYRFVAQPTSGNKAFVTSGKLLLMK